MTVAPLWPVDLPPAPKPAPNGDDSNGDAWTFPDPEIIRDKLSFRGWLERDIRPPDRLMGEWLTTTSRVLLIGPTGLGKTNIGLATAAFAAEGHDFLHWRGSGKPRRVLYVDGEMPERLMHSRAHDARRRLGTIPDTLFILSREDFPDDFPPLNTEKGQKFIEHFIEAVGLVDLVFFDNVQALNTGNMKEPEAWEPLLPWIRDLTRRKIGQIWFHHTGIDETRGYGDKTREWQLDTVILLERVELPAADIAFKIRFTKARERTPDNRADFDEAIITLADDTWSSEPSTHVRTAKPTKPRAADRVFELLAEAIAIDGEVVPSNRHVPPDARGVRLDTWRRYCEAGCISEGDPDPVKKAAADRKAFWRASNHLLAARRVGTWREWVWIA